MKTISNITKLILLSGIIMLAGSTESANALFGSSEYCDRHGNCERRRGIVRGREYCDRHGNCERHRGLLGSTVGFAGDVAVGAADVAGDTADVVTGGPYYDYDYDSDEEGMEEPRD